MVLYSHLLKNFPQFVVIHTAKGFGIVNKAEIDVFLELSWFFSDPMDVGLPWGSDSKVSTCNVGDLSLIPGLGRSPGEGNGNPLQYSRLGNSTDRGHWQATVLGVAKSQT